MTIDDNNIPLPPEPPEPEAESFEPASIDAVPPGVPAITLYPGNTGRALPDDLRVPWDWLDIVLLAVLAVGGALVTGILIVTVLGFFGVTLAHLRKSPSDLSLLAIGAQVALDLSLLAYLAAQMRLRFRLPFWSTIGWHGLETARISRGVAYAVLIFGGFVMAQIVSIVEPLFPPKHPLPLQTMLNDPHVAVVFVLMGVLLAPVVEETVFRGYLYPVVARSFGVGAGITITGLLFGLMHSGQLWGGWWQIALLVFVGIALTAARAATRTVVASYILHASYNAFAVIGPVISPFKIHHLPHIH